MESTANLLFISIESNYGMIGADRSQLSYPPLNSIACCEQDCGGDIFVEEVDGVQEATENKGTSGIVFFLGLNTLIDVFEIVLIDSAHYNSSRLFLLAPVQGSSPDET